MANETQSTRTGLSRRVRWSAAIVLSVAYFSYAIANRPQRKPSNAKEGSRQLQSSILTSFFELIIPWYRPNEYIIQPIDSFDLYEVCTNLENEGCEESNLIKFTNQEIPGDTEFRYQDQGPVNMQGVFWAQMELLNLFLGPTDLLSFAKTRHGNGVQTGVLETDANGYEYVVRPIGDHTWSRERQEPAFYLQYFDALYLFDLTEGTLEDPRAFTITPTFKLFFSCFRFNFGRAITAMFFFFDMVLVTDPANELVLKYPGSVIWERSTLVLGLIPFTYPAIQIVDGNGQPIEAAYQAWQSSTPTNAIIGLREDGIDEVLTC